MWGFAPYSPPLSLLSHWLVDRPLFAMSNLHPMDVTMTVRRVAVRVLMTVGQTRLMAEMHQNAPHWAMVLEWFSLSTELVAVAAYDHHYYYWVVLFHPPNPVDARQDTVDTNFHSFRGSCFAYRQTGLAPRRWSMPDRCHLSSSEFAPGMALRRRLEYHTWWPISKKKSKNIKKHDYDQKRLNVMNVS